MDNQKQNDIILGVDTHLDKHIAVLLNGMGTFIDVIEIET